MVSHCRYLINTFLYHIFACDLFDLQLINAIDLIIVIEQKYFFIFALYLQRKESKSITHFLLLVHAHHRCQCSSIAICRESLEYPFHYFLLPCARFISRRHFLKEQGQVGDRIRVWGFFPGEFFLRTSWQKLDQDNNQYRQ